MTRRGDPRPREDPRRREDPRPQQEGFGEAGLGEAQSSNPPADPEMIEEDPGTHAGEVPPEPGEGVAADREQEERPSGEPRESAERGVEQVGGDQDAGPTATPDELADGQRDRAGDRTGD